MCVCVYIYIYIYIGEVALVLAVRLAAELEGVDAVGVASFVCYAVGAVSVHLDVYIL